MGKISSFAHKLRKNLGKKIAVVATVVALAAVGAGVAVNVSAAEKADCDANAVMYCGAYDLSTVNRKYNESASTRAIFAASPFGISRAEFNSLASGYKIGSVTRDNKVIVDGRVVASNAVTAGRQYIPGSTKMNIPGVTAYTRAPSVSFKQASLSAFVKLDANGKFQFAIIRACGNPVTGTPTPPPAKPGFTMEKKVRIAGTNNPFVEDVTVQPGQKVEYVISAKNTGNTTLTNVRVKDALPRGMSFVSNSTYMVSSYSAKRTLPNGIVSAGVNIGNMPAGGAAFVFFQATAPKATDTTIKLCEDGKTRLRNVGFVKPSQLPEKNDDAYIQTCRPSKPNFEIEKKVKKAGTNDQFTENVFAAPGSELTFAISVKNTGNTTLKNILIKDVLPAGMTFVPGSAKLSTSEGVSNRPISDNLVTTGYTLSSLGANQTAFVLFNAKLPVASNPIVKECEVGKTRLVNKANAKPENLPVKEDDASAETCKEKELKPNFVMQKDVRKVGDNQAWVQDVTVKYGDSVQYRILVTNTGETDLKNVLVKDRRPAGVDYTAGSLRVNGQPSNQDLFGSGVTIPEIKKGASAEITFGAKVAAVKPDLCRDQSFKNIASALPEGLTVKEDDAIVRAECEAFNPKVAIAKKVNKTVVNVNGQFVYTLEVTNTGDIDLTNVKVTDPAPEGVDFLSSNTPTGTTTNVTARNFEATIAKMTPGQKVVFDLQAKVTKEMPGQITNTACVDAPEVPGTPDDCDSVNIKTPKYECRSLVALSLGDLKYRFTALVNKTETVTLTSIAYNFGDGSAVVTQNNQNPVEHQYAEVDEEKTYTITATVQFSVGGEVKEDVCTAQVKISPEADEPCPYNPNLPKDDPNCVKPCPYDPNLPADHPDCVEEPEEPPVTPPSQPPVTVIPDTGLAGAATGTMGISSMAYAAYAWVESRRNLRK